MPGEGSAPAQGPAAAQVPGVGACCFGAGDGCRFDVGRPGLLHGAEGRRCLVLPAVLQTAGAPDGRQMTAALVDWAHARLTVACTGPRPGTAAHALPGLHLELTVATLLLECASRVLCPTWRPAPSLWRRSAVPCAPVRPRAGRPEPRTATGSRSYGRPTTGCAPGPASRRSRRPAVGRHGAPPGPVSTRRGRAAHASARCVRSGVPAVCSAASGRCAGSRRGPVGRTACR